MTQFSSIFTLYILSVYLKENKIKEEKEEEGTYKMSDGKKRNKIEVASQIYKKKNIFRYTRI